MQQGFVEPLSSFHHLPGREVPGPASRGAFGVVSAFRVGELEDRGSQADRGRIDHYACS